MLLSNLVPALSLSIITYTNQYLAQDTVTSSATIMIPTLIRYYIFLWELCLNSLNYIFTVKKKSCFFNSSEFQKWKYKNKHNKKYLWHNFWVTFLFWKKWRLGWLNVYMKIYNGPCQMWLKIFKSKLEKQTTNPFSKKLDNQKAKLNSALL